MIDGIGVDIIEIDRIERAIRRARFRDHVFTAAEQAYCEPGGPERWSGRFAAKEAVAKALGCSLPWLDVEILCSASGAPQARLHRKAAERLAGRRLLVTISHCRTYAVAHALVEAAP